MTLPTLAVLAPKVTGTFASPSTSTDTEPNVATILGRVATACPFTPTPDTAPVAD